MPCGSKRKNWTRFAMLVMSLPLLATQGGCGMLQKLGYLPPPQTKITAMGAAPACETFERVCLVENDRVTDGTLYKIIGNNVAGKAAGCWDECR
jgi:hypothetical protein